MDIRPHLPVPLFLPFTIVMAGLSRWAGGLLDRFGARLPLVIGPAIAALGIGVMAATVTNGSYWQFLVSIVILGFGVVVSVAPLTTTVINAVPAHQAAGMISPPRKTNPRPRLSYGGAFCSARSQGRRSRSRGRWVDGALTGARSVIDSAKLGAGESESAS